MDECYICGDDHDDGAHGDALVIRDWSVRTAENMVDVAVVDAMELVERRTDSADPSSPFQRLCKLYDEWNQLTEEVRDTDGTLLDIDVEPGEFLDDVESILGDAGFFAFSDSDAGSWLVFGPANVIVGKDGLTERDEGGMTVNGRSHR